MDKLIELASTFVSGVFIAVLVAWLTNRSRNRREQQAEIGALRVQADAMTVAVMELQGVAAACRLVWEGPVERARTFPADRARLHRRGRPSPDRRWNGRAERPGGLRARG
ncbi:hypothetical protein [Streptomyces sp. NPDC018584]|uniref:hypothetical protein n=1 Tax=unclassified Streptomyces TaxID=2593676 RepID=UPI0037B7AD36